MIYRLYRENPVVFLNLHGDLHFPLYSIIMNSEKLLLRELFYEPIQIELVEIY